MHIPDGFLDTPVALATAGAAAMTVAYATRRTGREMGERTVPLLGVTAAFIFAAQMLNFPVAVGTSGHFLGAAFAAIVMGPWAAMVVMAAVVAVQAVGMADGGITALGANALNMGIVAVLAAHGVHRILRALLPGTTTWYLASVAAAAWVSIVAAALAVSFELGASGIIPFRLVAPAMTSVHMVIGIGEALITTAVLGTVLASRPDLVKSPPRTHAAGPGGTPARARARRTWPFLAAGLATAAALAVLVSPFASQAPDGLQRVAIEQGFAEDVREAAWDFFPLPDYRLPGSADPRIGTAVAGLVGTLVMFALVLGLGRALGRRRPALQATTGTAAAIHALAGHEHTDHRHAGHSHRGHTHSPHVPEDTDLEHTHAAMGQEPGQGREDVRCTDGERDSGRAPETHRHGGDET